MPKKSKTNIKTTIHLQDVGIDIQTAKKGVQAAKKGLLTTMRPTEQGIEISIPKQPVKARVLAALQLLRFNIPICLLTTIMVLIVDTAIRGGFTIKGMLQTLAGISFIFLIPIIGSMAHIFFGKETVIISSESMIILTSVFWTKRAKTYSLDKMSNLRFPVVRYRHSGNLLFDYEGELILFGYYLPYATAKILLKQVTKILDTHAHSIERIIFGTSHCSLLNPSTWVHNPDVSTLHVPFGHLQQIVIDTETYDFHVVERFLTYAINYIGQDYLKEHVEVHLYGEIEKLHTNLRNNLTTLCKHVYVHERDEPLVPMEA